MSLFAVFFGSLMLLSVGNPRRMLAILLIASITVVAVAPPPAQAQVCLPCAIQTVLTMISQTLGSWLNRINQTISAVRTLYQQAIWPLNVINQVKTQIRSVIAQFDGVIRSIFVINPHTATLANPIALENIIRNRTTADLNGVPQMYINTFRPVPPSGQMAPAERNMMDMDDAMAQDNLMVLKQADHAQDLELQAADQMESLVSDGSINVSAPGTAALITASAVTAEIKSQAVMQKMLAAMLRQEAARVAHDNALRKRNSAIAVQVQTNVTNMLQHR
jgi:hypothetical protein